MEHETQTSAPHPRRSPILPFDIHAKIVKWVYRLYRNTRADSQIYQTIHRCSIVCKDWTAPSQALLFRRVAHVPHIHRSRLLDTLRGKPVLGAYVRYIDIVVNERNFPPKPDDPLPDILALCPNIEVFSLNAVPGCVAHWGERLARAQLRPVVLQIISGCQDLDQLLRMWPDARYVSIKPLFDGNWGVPAALPTLSGALHGVSIASGSGIVGTDWLLSFLRPDSQISELRLIFGHKEKVLLPLVAAHVPPRLRALSCTRIPSEALFPPLRTVESLAFWELPDAPVPLPPSIRRLVWRGYRGPVENMEAQWRERLGHFLRMLPTLPHLEYVVVASVHYVHGDIPELLDACRALDIEAVWDPHPGAFLVCRPFIFANPFWS